MATRSARITPAPPSGAYGGSVAAARRLNATPVRAAALAAPTVDADGYLDFVPRAALDRGGGGGGFPGAVPARGGNGSKAASARPSKQAEDGAGGGELPALRKKTVRVDPSKQKPYTSKFITERKAGERAHRPLRPVLLVCHPLPRSVPRKPLAGPRADIKIAWVCRMDVRRHAAGQEGDRGVEEGVTLPTFAHFSSFLLPLLPVCSRLLTFAHFCSLFAPVCSLFAHFLLTCHSSARS